MNAEEYLKHGDKNFSERNFNGAISDFSEVIKLDPANPFAYYRRGLSYHNTKEFDLAIADFTKAIQIEPNKFGNFYFDRCGAYIYKGDTNMAISDIEMASKIDPQNKDYRELLEELKSDKQVDGLDKQTIALGDPNEDLKRRLKFIIVLVGIWFIIGMIYSFSHYSTHNVIQALLLSLIIGIIMGVLGGIGIVPWLGYAKDEFELIPYHIKECFADANGIVDLIKILLLDMIILILLWIPIKLFFLSLICPFIGIYQIIILLIERKKDMQQ